jgi:hypothetical protein
MEETGRTVAIDILVKLKLGAFHGWSAPKPLHNVGPSHAERFNQFEMAVHHIEEQLREALETRNDADLRFLIGKNAESSTAEWFDHLLKNEISTLARKEPIWLALGFGHPDHAADFNYWSKVGLLSVQEATLLSVGIEPDKEHSNFLERVRDAAGDPKKNEQAIFLSKRYRLMRDYFPFGVSSFISVSPAWFMALIKKIDLEVPDDLRAGLAYLNETSLDAGTVERPETMAASEKGSLLRMVAAMACEQYGFDPSEPRSQAVPSLRQDLDSVGLPLDDKTIRKWLREACELVPSEYWDRR